MRVGTGGGMPAPALLLALVVLLARGASAQTTLAAGSALLPTTACPASTVAIGSITYTVPCGLVVTYNLTTTPLSNTSPVWTGINSGHNQDPSWLAYTKRLGVNAVRIFGLAGSIPGSSTTSTATGLQTWFTAGGGTWGGDLTGSPSYATFKTAVGQLRTIQGHTPGGVNPLTKLPWSNPPRWATYVSMMTTANVGATGNSMQSMITQLQAAGIEPLLVFWLGCANFAFSTLDSSSATYWAEHWELYRHTYMAMRWAYLQGVRKFEFWNEPDLSSPCITQVSWLEYYTLQSSAIQNAFADAQADVLSGYITCPVGNCTSFAPIIYASAFAQATFAGLDAAAVTTPSPYIATYPKDYYSYFPQETVQNEHTQFPISLTTGTLTLTPSPAVQNMMAMSVHSYGKTGLELVLLGTTFAGYIASNRSRLPGDPATLPYAVTEHAAHTTATWNTVATTADQFFEASRLGSQILLNAAQGFETYIFKFSAADQSSGISPGCQPSTSATYSVAVACGVQKVGLHWGENLNAPYPIGDTTLSAEAARLVINAMAGGFTLETVSAPAYSVDTYVHPWVFVEASPNKNIPALASPAVAVSNDGRRRRLVFVNDGGNPTDSAATAPYVAYPLTATFQIAPWAVPATAALVYNCAAAGSMGEVCGIALDSSSLLGAITGATIANGYYNTITVVAPAYSTNVIVAPIIAQTEVDQLAIADTTVYAGANLGSTIGGRASSLTVSTSITATHDATCVSLIKFNVSSASATLTAVLEVTVATAPSQDMVLSVIGLSPFDTTALAWQESTLTWSGAADFLTTPTVIVNSPVNNFVRFDTGSSVVGHITVPASTAVGTTKRIDVTEYVRSAVNGYATFMLVRKLRFGNMYGNKAGVGGACTAGSICIAADNLSGGAAVSFYSREAGVGKQPVLRQFVGSAPPPSKQLVWQKSTGIVSTAGNSYFTRSALPFLVQGATINATANLTNDLARLASYGVNTVRLYTPDAPTLAAVTAAGLDALVGFTLPPLGANPLFYSSPANTAPLLQNITTTVQALLAQGANNVLAWTLGNELEYGCTSATPGFAAMWAFVGSAAAAIAAIDTAHPVGVVINMASIAAATPSIAATPGIGFVGVNGVYGVTFASRVGPLLAAGGWSGPWLATELGPRFSTSPEAANTTTWGTHFEPPSSVKAADLIAAFSALSASAGTTFGGIGANKGGFAGAFVANYGWQYQGGPTYLSMVNNYNILTAIGSAAGSQFPTATRALALDAESSVVDAMVQVYSGAPPANRGPLTNDDGISVTGIFFQVPGGPTVPPTTTTLYQNASVSLLIGSTYTATFPVTDPEGTLLTYQWQIFPRSPSGTVIYNPPPGPEQVGVIVSQNDAAGTMTFTTPVTPGYYKLHVWVQDGEGKFATGAFAFNASTARPPVTVPVMADTYITDGTLLASGTYTPSAYANFGSATTMVMNTGLAAGLNAYPYLQFDFGIIPSGATPASCLISLVCESGDPSFTLVAYAVSNTIVEPWPEATLSWYNANVTAAPGYPFNQVGYRSPAGSLAVKQCTGNRVFLDITTWCQWCADYNASYLSVALATAAPTVASTVFGSKEGANGAVLIVSEPLIPTTSTLGVAAVAPKAPTPVAAGRRRLLTGAGNFTNPVANVSVVDQSAAIASAVVQAIPGLNPLALSVNIASYSVAAALTVTGVTQADWVPAVQTAFAQAMAADLNLTLDLVALGALSFTPGDLNTAAVIIPFQANGFVGGTDNGLLAAKNGVEDLIAAASFSGSNLFAAIATLPGTHTITLATPSLTQAYAITLLDFQSSAAGTMNLFNNALASGLLASIVANLTGATVESATAPAPASCGVAAPYVTTATPWSLAATISSGAAWVSGTVLGAIGTVLGAVGIIMSSCILRSQTQRGAARPSTVIKTNV